MKEKQFKLKTNLFIRHRTKVILIQNKQSEIKMTRHRTVVKIH